MTEKSTHEERLDSLLRLMGLTPDLMPRARYCCQCLQCKLSELKLTDPRFDDYAGRIAQDFFR